jgi:hypothetical protein
MDSSRKLPQNGFTSYYDVEKNKSKLTKPLYMGV